MQTCLTTLNLGLLQSRADHTLPLSASSRIALSKVCSATSFLSLLFSSRSWRSSRTSTGPSPPYFLSHTQKIASGMPNCRHTSFTGVLCFTSFRAYVTCSSMNHERFMALTLLLFCRTQKRPYPTFDLYSFSGGTSQAHRVGTSR